jgi:hypothetical protein
VAREQRLHHRARDLVVQRRRLLGIDIALHALQEGCESGKRRHRPS